VTGTVKEIRVKEGQKIKVGQVIFTVDNGVGTQAPSPAKQTAAPAPKAAPAAAPVQAAAAAAPARRATDASAPTDFKLPELGENIEQGELVRLMISPGAKVSEGQPVMELETDKAVVEVPSSVTGVVKDILVKQGEKIKVGQVIFTLEGGAAPQAEKARHAPVEHFSEQTAARLTFQTAIQAEGKTEQQALPPDKPQPLPPSFTMPAQLGQSRRKRSR
jgi:pyruvate dehydrogenase E2 component (dihydrolipoamide acetyltransferase)